MKTYLIRNDVTGHVWEATAAEARMYAIGGIVEGGVNHSVFERNGSPLCLHVSLIQ